MLYFSTCKIEVSNKGRKCTDTLIVEPLNSLLPFENFTIELYQLEKSLVLLLYFLLLMYFLCFKNFQEFTIQNIKNSLQFPPSLQES